MPFFMASLVNMSGILGALLVDGPTAATGSFIPVFKL